MATNAPDPKQEIPWDQMSKEEQTEFYRLKEKEGNPEDFKWTQAKRDRFKQDQELDKEREEENNSIFNPESPNFLKLVDVKEDDSALVKVGGFLLNGGLLGWAAREAGGTYEEPSKEEIEAQKLKEEQLKEKIRVNHQAYLLFNHQQLTAESRNEASRFHQFAQIDHDYPAEINNLMFKKPISYDILLNSKSAQLSYFVPKIRLFKEYKVGDQQVVHIELPITQPYQNENFDSMFKDKEGRGGGVGIKNFKWNTIGTGYGNQFSFGAELELFFESIGEISKVRSKIGRAHV